MSLLSTGRHANQIIIVQNHKIIQNHVNAINLHHNNTLQHGYTNDNSCSNENSIYNHKHLITVIRYKQHMIQTQWTATVCQYWMFPYKNKLQHRRWSSSQRIRKAAVIADLRRVHMSGARFTKNLRKNPKFILSYKVNIFIDFYM